MVFRIHQKLSVQLITIRETSAMQHTLTTDQTPRKIKKQTEAKQFGGRRVKRPPSSGIIYIYLFFFSREW